MRDHVTKTWRESEEGAFPKTKETSSAWKGPLFALQVLLWTSVILSPYACLALVGPRGIHNPLQKDYDYLHAIEKGLKRDQSLEKIREQFQAKNPTYQISADQVEIVDNIIIFRPSGKIQSEHKKIALAKIYVNKTYRLFDETGYFYLSKMDF